MCQVLKKRLKSEDGKAEKDDNLSESARKAVDKVAGVKRRQLKAGSCDRFFFLMLHFLIVTLDGSEFRCLDLDILGFLVLVLDFYASIYFISSNRLNVFHVTMRHFLKIVHQ